MSRPPAPPLPRLFARTSDWFARAAAGLLGEVPCRKGCHHCCIGLFPVTLLDRQAVQQGLRSLPDERRTSIAEKARRQADMISAGDPRLADDPFIDTWSDGEIDRVVEQYCDLPCPALQTDGSCGIYAFRPLTCRSMGIPPEAEGTVRGACEVQTSVPLVRLSRSLRQEEERLAAIEAEEIARLQSNERGQGEELFLPYAFLPED